jgi:serine phosphatase RsbU (regulator of sigma subunit)
MRVTPLRWPDGRSALVSLFDVSGRTRRYEHEHRLVESLQRSLLPEQLPVLPGIELAASYEPAASDVRIGGDWYDAIPLGGRLGLAIGDVAGHGIDSAALMGRLRNALRAYAIDDPAPARVLARLGHLVYELERRSMATVTYLVYDPAARRLEFASAGHPYPLLVRPDGAPEFLRGGRSSALGAGDGMRRLSDGLHVPAGSVLVLYTDGLIERRTRSLDDGMAALAATATGLPRDARGACRTLLGNLVEGEGVDDDVAVLVMRTA